MIGWCFLYMNRRKSMIGWCFPIVEEGRACGGGGGGEEVVIE